MINGKKTHLTGALVTSTMLPSLSKLSIGGNNRRKHTDNRVELFVTESIDRIDHPSGEIFNVACVSAAEMTIAKVVLDALVNESIVVRRRGKLEILEMPFHARLIRGYKKHLIQIFEEIGWIEADLKKSLELATGDAIEDIKKSIKIIDLLRPSTVSPLEGESNDADVEAVSSMYKQFLFDYAEERGIPRTQLLTTNDDDDDDDNEQREIYTTGVNSVLSEYFVQPYFYATSTRFTNVLRAFAKNQIDGRLFCVGVVMMNPKDHHNGLMGQGDYKCGDKRPIRIQGIVACSIFKHFFHASVGSALLEFVQAIAAKEGKFIAVDPIKKNKAWEAKLRRSENVVIGLNSRQ